MDTAYQSLQLTEKTLQALASLALEDMHPSKALLADIQLFDKGELSKEALLARTLERLKR